MQSIEIKTHWHEFRALKLHTQHNWLKQRRKTCNLHDSHQMHEMHVCFLTEHWEDEIFGRVDLQCSLVVIFALFVLREVGDQSVEFLRSGAGPEVELGRDVFGAGRCGGGAAGSGTRPAGERRRRHVWDEDTVNRSSAAHALYGGGGGGGQSPTGIYFWWQSLFVCKMMRNLFYTYSSSVPAFVPSGLTFLFFCLIVLMSASMLLYLFFSWCEFWSYFNINLSLGEMSYS